MDHGLLLLTTVSATALWGRQPPPPPTHCAPAAHRAPPCVRVPLQGWRETIRFIPPLVISEFEVGQALDMFRRGLGDAIKALN